MRLHRLVLRNWRGVEEREVPFAENGVTVVEGPNESGKSCLVEAIDALFTHLDDSKKQAVLAIKPVHKDAGAEVEAEIESGPYRFTFFKRFHRRPETRLVVTAPKAENLTGRDAHERARQILEETMDMALWSALRIEQGQEITQANLADQKSLSAALDRAAGVAAVGEAEQTLFAAARAEFGRYFTPTGAALKDTMTAETEVARLAGVLGADKAELATLVADVERSAQLDRDLIEATEAAGESKKKETLHDERLREIDKFTAQVGEAKAKYDGASAAAEEAEQRAVERTKVIEEAEAADKSLTIVAIGDDLALPAHEAAAIELAEAEESFAAASAKYTEAEDAATVAQRDFEHATDKLDLQLLGERMTRIAAADAAAAQAETVLATNSVTDDVLKKVQAAHLEQEKARAALTAGSPELRFRALGDVEPLIDGEKRKMSAGDETTLPVVGSLSLRLPGVAEVEVRTGSSTTDLRDAFEKKSKKFAEVCRSAAVSDLEQATLANAEWRDARRDVDARDGVVARDLRDLSREQMAQLITDLERRVPAYAATRTSLLPRPPNIEAAKEANATTKAQLDAAKKARTKAESRREAARVEADRLLKERTRVEIGRERTKTEAAMTASRLAQARAKSSDADITKRLEAARETLRVAESAHREVADRLAAMQPDATRVLATNARAVRDRAEKRLRGIEDDRIQVRTRLNERGEAGLAERVDATESRLVRAKDDLDRRRVHAAAARLLFETLDAARAESRKAYVAPLRGKIENLGRIVYGPTFTVEVNEQLQIDNRTLDGRTVPFESLSGGAKEQLGVISRLACALTVADYGGVPVIFDDTLGNTDPGRIEAMCALLALAGGKCQVIVLTCVPDRFSQVGAASVVKVL